MRLYVDDKVYEGHQAGERSSYKALTKKGSVPMEMT